MTDDVKGKSSAVAIALCFLVALAEGFDIQAMGVAAPRLAPELGLNPDQMGWIFSISNIGLLIAATVGGWLADRIGRKPILIAAVVVFGVLTLVTTLAKDYQVLFVARLLVGVGFGAALPNIMAIAADVSKLEHRALTASAIFCGLPIGAGTSALFTQFLPAQYDWRILFLVGGYATLALAPLLIFLLPETKAPMREAASISPLKALFGQGRAWPTLLIWTALLPTLLILYVFLNWLPTLVVAKGLDRTVAPQASLAFNYAGAAGALLLGYVVDRSRSRWPLALAFAGLIGVLVLLSQSSGLGNLLLLSGAAGFCLVGANFALYGVAASYYPANVRGTGSGAAVGVGRAGSVIGPLVAGGLLSAGATAEQVILFLTPAAALAGLAVALLVFFAPRGD